MINNPSKGVKIFIIALVSVLILTIPITVILFPIQFIGNMFKNTWGTVEEVFDYGYSGNFAEEVDSYMASNRISLDYKQLLACSLSDVTADPKECLINHDSNGNILSQNAETEYFVVDWPEYHGHFEDYYFKEIHVLGKYTTSNWEIVGQHEEKTLIGYEKKPDINGAMVEDKTKPIYKTIIVDDYNWVYHPELKRGKCKESDTQKCHITLEDRDVYPFQWVGAGIKNRYGLQPEKETYDISVTPDQKWYGYTVKAFSKGNVVSVSDGELVVVIDANGIDLIATYRGELSSLFSPGETVEATETIAYSDSDFMFYLQNSAGEYINPSLFFDVGNVRSGPGYYDGSYTYVLQQIMNGTLLLNYPAEFTPDFSNKAAWAHSSEGGTNNYAYGQCTWFAYGMYYQINGHAPYGCKGNGTSWASTLNDSGYQTSSTPTAGSLVSANWLPDHQYGTVAIVLDVISEDEMYILHGNSNANLYEDSWDVAVNDWAVQKVSTKGYRYSNGSFATWSIQSPVE